MVAYVKLDCGDPRLAKDIANYLRVLGIEVDSLAKLLLLVDEPPGWAAIQATAFECEHLILSNNPCHAYLLDLLESSPAALLRLYEKELEALPETLRRIRAGERLYPKDLHTNLTPSERLTLRLAVKGYSNKRIAKVRKVIEGSVRNTLVSIYKKLELKYHSRVLLSHYYYGQWHLLEGWTPPAHPRHLVDDRSHLDMNPWQRQ
jgi:DNA-binding CsgD family transcriptional regulator